MKKFIICIILIFGSTFSYSVVSADATEMNIVKLDEKFVEVCAEFNIIADSKKIKYDLTTVINSQTDTDVTKSFDTYDIIYFLGYYHKYEIVKENNVIHLYLYLLTTDEEGLMSETILSKNEATELIKKL